MLSRVNAGRALFMGNFSHKNAMKDSRGLCLFNLETIMEDFFVPPEGRLFHQEDKEYDACHLWRQVE
jgi:hypothetical protein